MQPYLLNSSDQTKKDTALTIATFEVSMQLIKNAWNQHHGGEMWYYWFSLPMGYEVTPMQDNRLTQAGVLLKALMTDSLFDSKMRNFLTELYAYTQLVAGNTDKARELYRQSVSDPNQAFPVSYQRAKAMLTKL